jgi:hypothetical protein
MRGGDRLFWFEWAGGIVGTVFFLVLGVLAISQHHILFVTRISASPLDGPSAQLFGVCLVFAAWWCFTLMLRLSRHRRLWGAVSLIVGLVVAAAAYGGVFDF